jgi:hypothetical protein
VFDDSRKATQDWKDPGAPVLAVPDDDPADEVPLVDVPLVDVPLVDVPLVDVPLVDVPLVDVPLVDVPLVDVPLVDVPLVDVPLVDVPLEDVPLDVPVDDEPLDVPVADGVAAGAAAPDWPSGTFTSSPTVMTSGLAIWGLAASTCDSGTPDWEAMLLMVSPGCTGWLLARAGPAVKPTSTAPAPREIIPVRTFISLLVGIAGAQRSNVRRVTGRLQIGLRMVRLSGGQAGPG